MVAPAGIPVPVTSMPTIKPVVLATVTVVFVTVVAPPVSEKVTPRFGLTVSEPPLRVTGALKKVGLAALPTVRAKLLLIVSGLLNVFEPPSVPVPELLMTKPSFEGPLTVLPKILLPLELPNAPPTSMSKHFEKVSFDTKVSVPASLTVTSLSNVLPVPALSVRFEAVPMAERFSVNWVGLSTVSIVAPTGM